jgi:hypothetical protein
LIAHGRWFSPASSITKTGHNDIAEILLKVALSTINQIKSKSNHLQLSHPDPLKLLKLDSGANRMFNVCGNFHKCLLFLVGMGLCRVFCVFFFVNYKKGCTRLTATSDEVYQLLVHGQWFSPVLRLLPPLKLVMILLGYSCQKPDGKS